MLTLITSAIHSDSHEHDLMMRYSGWFVRGRGRRKGVVMSRLDLTPKQTDRKTTRDRQTD